MIPEVEILDEEVAARYREIAAESIAVYGGRYLARGAEPDGPEGNRRAAMRAVIVEFPSMRQLTEWYDSAEYAPGRALAGTALRRRLLFVPGMPASQ